ncbi:MAG: serine hydrolase [Anaerolineaceae bacterium]|nr:serine hydrolase [Anaerolineaceae bacterium]
MKTYRYFFLVILFLLPMMTIHAQDDIQSQLNSFVAEIAPKDGAAVSARITIGDKTWAAAGGLVDTTKSQAASPDDRFRIASMSKTWLAVVVMQLVEKGTLSLDDPVTKWLPDDLTSQIANADQATIRQLLTMISGIPEYLNDDFYAQVGQDTTHNWTPKEALTFAHNLPASFAPGEGFEYCNSNYLLLQLIVEAASKKPMHQLMREGIFTPLKLENTYVQIEEKGAPFVHGYEDFDGDGQIDDVTDYNDGAGLGDGALVSNTADLTRFYQGLFVRHEILGEASVQAMIDAGKNENEYGIALEVSEGDHGLQLGHTGSVLGFSGAVYYLPDLDATVVILYGSQSLDTAHVDKLIEIAASAGH